MIDYTGVGEALAARLATVEGVDRAGYEIDERDLNFANMPAIDVRYTAATNEVRAGQDYFTDLMFQCDIYSFHLSSVRQAVTVRDTILQAAQNVVRAIPSFHVSLESSRLGPVEFLTSKDENTGAFEARASFVVIAMAFTDR